jgi:hypothetical protein
LQQSRTPIRQHRRNPVRVSFCDKRVVFGLRLEQQGIQRPRGSIVWMEVKVRRRRSALRLERRGDRRTKRTLAPSGGKQRRSQSLATTDEELTPTRRRGARHGHNVRSIPRLPCPAQSDAPRLRSVIDTIANLRTIATESNIRFSTRQRSAVRSSSYGICEFSAGSVTNSCCRASYLEGSQWSRSSIWKKWGMLTPILGDS